MDSVKSSVKVDVGIPQHVMPPDLYGLFFEEITHAGEGGLYPELVQNRSFCDGVAPADFVLDGPEVPPDPKGLLWGTTPCGFRLGMKLAGDFPGWRLESENAVVRMEPDDQVVLAETVPRTLRLEFGDGPGTCATLVNEGYWKMAVEGAAEYRLTVIAQSSSSAIPVCVTLRDEHGVLCEVAFTVADGGWQREELILQPGWGSQTAELALTVMGSGSVWFAFVSLFPVETWKGRPNGMRPDLAAMLHALKPSFLRFPGGCFIEGVSLATAYDWKSSLGPVETRKGTWNLWGYANTQGIGYHEYLQLAEDLGASAMYVCNCGLSCQLRPPYEAFDDKQVDRFLQDALDAIEYALGSVTSEWGSKRASAGHPDPFPLKYLEIGNENFGDDYRVRYLKFYEAIHKQYPELILICDCWLEDVPLDVVDDHYYSIPSEFMRLSRRYDKADRDGPKIYVGEYAVTGECGEGSLRAALAEAAFMAGMERNSDVVVMASYAPIFVNVNDRAWNPDMIQFDNHRSCGTPSYWGQQMFAANKGERALSVTIEAEDSHLPPLGGGVGFVTWESVAEFKDLRVVSPNGDVLYENALTSSLNGLETRKGQWRISQEGLRSSNQDRDGFCLMDGDADWDHYTLTCKARQIGHGNGFMVAFHVQGDRHCRWQIGGWNNEKMALEYYTGGGSRMISELKPFKPVPGQWYDIRIEVNHDQIRCFLDGEFMQEAESLRTPQLGVSASLGGEEIILKLANGCDTAQDVTVDLGNVQIEPAAKEVLLVHANADAENTLDNPDNVIPHEHELSGMKPNFVHHMQPWSVAILKLRMVQ